jgi:hypothetical protein
VILPKIQLLVLINQRKYGSYLKYHTIVSWLVLGIFVLHEYIKLNQHVLIRCTPKQKIHRNEQYEKMSCSCMWGSSRDGGGGRGGWAHTYLREESLEVEEGAMLERNGANGQDGA